MILGQAEPPCGPVSQSLPSIVLVMNHEQIDPAIAEEELRRLVLDTAVELDVGPVQEYLAWGQPSFRVSGGTPVRVAAHGADRLALYVHCGTTLVGSWRAQWPELEFDGNRAVVLDPSKPLPEDALREMIASALTYR